MQFEEFRSMVNQNSPDWSSVALAILEAGEQQDVFLDTAIKASLRVGKFSEFGLIYGMYVESKSVVIEPPALLAEDEQASNVFGETGYFSSSGFTQFYDHFDNVSSTEWLPFDHEYTAAPMVSLSVDAQDAFSPTAAVKGLEVHGCWIEVNARTLDFSTVHYTVIGIKGQGGRCGF